MKVIISGGGTGGHIYPAIAIANEIKARNPKAEILFVGAKGRMEMEKVPAAGYPIEGLWISGIQRKLTLDNLSFPLKLLSSLWQSRKIIKKFKPDIAIGVGGYASGALLFAATQMKIPTLIQEQNSFAGLTNKWLSKRVHKICVAYQGMEKFFPKNKIILTGNPVRSDILQIEEKKQEAYHFFDLNPAKKTILVIGGSLGARSINEAVSKDLHKIVQSDAQILWQTGKNTFVQNPDNEPFLSNPAVKKTEFIYKMDLAYTVADVVISRAGALAVSELCIAGKPTIFVPLPSAAEDHQTQNAMALVKENAGELVKDVEASDKLIDAILNLLHDSDKCSIFRQNIRKLAKPDATQLIVDEVFRLIEKK